MYIRFYDSEIVELLVETGVGSECSIRSKFGHKVWHQVLQNPVLSHSSSKNRIHLGEWCGVQLPLFNNLIIANPCNVGVCPKKVE